jgi:hypothetical protein
VAALVGQIQPKQEAMVLPQYLVLSQRLAVAVGVQMALLLAHQYLLVGLVALAVV